MKGPHRQYVIEGMVLSEYDSSGGRRERMAPGTTRDSNEREAEEETYIHVYSISRDKVNRQIKRRTPCHAHE
jgi:hypothetical protein